jgi:predicted amidohydrolase
MRIGVVQLNSSDDPSANLLQTCDLIRRATSQDAEFIVTPEVTNIVSNNRNHQGKVLALEADDQSLVQLRALAAKLKIWLLIGSLALKTPDADGRFANRSFLIGPDGEIVARYDKLHMFDIAVNEQETYQESAGYRPGDSLKLARTPFGNIGMTICYDIRFPHLYRDLAQMGADILMIPAAFSSVTGAAHWKILLQARAIETGCFVIAPAQTGTHIQTDGSQRITYGHSMIVDPWGAVLLDAGVDQNVSVVDIDLEMVAQTRKKLPSLTHDRNYRKPVQ